MADQEEIDLVKSIMELVNLKTGEKFTEQQARQFLRSAMQRRAKAARRLAAWRASRRQHAETA